MLYLIIQQFEDFVKDKIMKVEKIYEIPVNEAFDNDCECALCFLEKNLEDKNTEFFLGPAMMKPEFRIETNKKGFCRRHLSKMLENQNRLPLSLMLDTHLNSLNEILDRKKGIKKTRDIDFILTELSAFENSCAVCDYINDTFVRYINVILYMWQKNEEFRDKLLSSKGFCVPHFYQLLKTAKKELSKKEFTAFSDMLTDIEVREMKRINEEINWFTKKFDYKNKDADWKNSKDAPQRTVMKLKKFTE